jgi:hypothetical protein
MRFKMRLVSIPAEWIPQSAWEIIISEPQARRVRDGVINNSYREALSGRNAYPPSVAILYNGFVSELGAVMTCEVYISAPEPRGGLE